jgi:molybdenum cofactor guanylyltransferase
VTPTVSDTLPGLGSGRLAHRAPAGLACEALGAVFCGGASRRMGRDKAQLVLAGETLIARAVAVLRGVTPRVLLASGQAPRYPELGLECLLDVEADAGPLAGLAAVLARLEREGLEHACVLACDMPEVSPEVFTALLARARTSAAEVVLVSTETGSQPLCGVYHARALPAVRAALARGERRMDSFHMDSFNTALRVELLPEAELAPGCARNLNTPDDYRAAGGSA